MLGPRGLLVHRPLDPAIVFVQLALVLRVLLGPGQRVVPLKVREITAVVDPQGPDDHVAAAAVDSGALEHEADSGLVVHPAGIAEDPESVGRHEIGCKPRFFFSPSM